MTPDILLDEHVSRILEGVLRDRGYSVAQAKDRFGEETNDDELLQWCGEHEVVLLTNNADDFEQLHTQIEHSGLFLYRDQRLPDDDPEGFAHAIDTVFQQYGSAELTNEVVDLGEWYDWLQP